MGGCFRLGLMEKHESTLMLMPSRIVFVLAIFCISKLAISSERSQPKLTDELLVNIFEFLPDEDAQKLPILGKDQERMFKQLGVGDIFRKKSKYAVQAENDIFFFLSEYLDSRGSIPLKSVKNIKILLQENPIIFIQVIAKGKPYMASFTKSKLSAFYSETTKVNELIDIAAPSNTPEQRLADIILELLVWSEFISSNVYHKISTVAEAQISEKIGQDAWEGVRVQVLDEINSHVIERTGIPLMAQISDQLGKPVEDRFLIDLTLELKHIYDWPELVKDIDNIDFGSAYLEDNLRELLSSTIDYVFTLIQLESLAMKNCPDFKKTRDNLVHYLAKKGRNYCQFILDSININDLMVPEENDPIGTEIKLINKNLP